MERSQQEHTNFGTGSIVGLVISAVLALIGAGLTLGGGALVWAHATERDADGYYSSAPDLFSTPSYALTGTIDGGDGPDGRGVFQRPLATIRVIVESPADRALFVGIAPEPDVDRWLAGVAHEEVTRVDFGPFRRKSTVVSGTRIPSSPADQTFWAAASTGRGRQEILWPVEDGRWSVVVLNSDASAGVTADVEVGARTGLLLPIGLGLGFSGLLLLAVATALCFRALRHHAAVPVVRQAAPAPLGTYPARLDGHLAPSISRWRWLVKWVLVIPHVIVLAFLWIAVTMLTVFAGFAILFTGRYPRSVFDFNVGVMRWTWRVSFYGISALGTDQYPPFSLRPDPDYPADFNVDFPDRLSRGLVLVKWWLLAIPHYLIVAILAGGWGIGWTGGWRMAGGWGLIMVLTLVAGIMLAVRGRYPDGLFDFIMGLNRWCYRVLAYVALMRDEYPPFTLDKGGLDPGSIRLPTEPLQPGPPGDTVDSAL